MSQIKSQAAPTIQSGNHWPSLLQLLLSLFAMLVLLLFALILLGSGLVNLLADPQSQTVVTGTFMAAAGLLFTACLLFPSAYFAYLRINDRPIQAGRISSGMARLSERALFWLTPLLALGALVSQNAPIALIFLPPIHALSAALIVLWLIVIATRKLELGSQQRNWGVLAAGLSLGPLLALSMEIVVGIFFFLIGSLYVFSQPQLLSLLERLSEMNLSNVNDGQILAMLEPMLSDPFVLLMILAFVGLAVPLIEELIKPIGLYLSMSRKWTPAAGFALAVLSGAGFAIFENLSLGANSVGWLAVIVARIGTSSMHLLTTGLTGWALVRARNEKRYLPLFGTYLVSVSMHGLWNSLVILITLSVFDIQIGSLAINSSSAIALSFGLLVLALGSIFLLGFNNRKLRAQFNNL